MVNRYWKMFMGEGLVDTVEDFGSGGEPPTHPELLDWLAVEFMESGWDVRHMVRLIVNSSTYRQSSVMTSQLVKVDPEKKTLPRSVFLSCAIWLAITLVSAEFLPTADRQWFYFSFI